MYLGGAVCGKSRTGLGVLPSIQFLSVGRIGVEILRGVLIAGAWGFLVAACGFIVSVDLFLLFRLVWVFIFGLPDSDLGTFVEFLTIGTLKASLPTNLVLVPLSFVVGLVYSIIRRAVPHGVESSLTSDS